MNDYSRVRSVLHAAPVRPTVRTVDEMAAFHVKLWILDTIDPGTRAAERAESQRDLPAVLGNSGWAAGIATRRHRRSHRGVADVCTFRPDIRIMCVSYMRVWPAAVRLLTPHSRQVPIQAPHTFQALRVSRRARVK